MTKTLWAPSLKKLIGPHIDGGSMLGGEPRAVHHITWDKLGPKGERPSFMGVAGYLLTRGFEPHVMLDPILGGGVQFLPFDRSAYALEHRGNVETNRMGSACIQVEWFFSPGCVVNGKRYLTLQDTPMLGLGLILEVAKEYGIPPVFPAGAPTWPRSNRSETIWKTKAGHYGHGNVPTNSHTDPGPMPALTKEEDDMNKLDPQDKQDIIAGVVAALGGPRPTDHSDPNPKVISLGDVLTSNERQAERVIAKLDEVVQLLKPTGV